MRVQATCICAPGERPRVRIDGQLYLVDTPSLSDGELRDYLFSMLNDTQTDRFDRTHELDFSFSLPGVTRMRFNLFIQQSTLCASIRMIPQKIPTYGRHLSAEA